MALDLLSCLAQKYIVRKELFFSCKRDSTKRETHLEIYIFNAHLFDKRVRERFVL